MYLNNDASGGNFRKPVTLKLKVLELTTILGYFRILLDILLLSICKTLIGDVTQSYPCPYRFWGWFKEKWSPDPKDRADRPPKNVPVEDRDDRLTEHVPLNAGFFACLCHSGNVSPGESMLRYCCYPIHLEEPVRNSVCAAFDVFSYGYGNSLEPLCPNDLIYLALRKGLETTDDEDALNDGLPLR